MQSTHITVNPEARAVSSITCMSRIREVEFRCAQLEASMETGSMMGHTNLAKHIHCQCTDQCH